MDKRAIMGMPNEPPTRPAFLKAAGMANSPAPRLAFIRYTSALHVLFNRHYYVNAFGCNLNTFSIYKSAYDSGSWCPTP